MALSAKPVVDGTIRAGDIAKVLDIEFDDYIFGGFRVSTNSTTSTAVSIPSGSGMLQGYYIEEDGTGSVNTANASSRGYLFIQLTLNGVNEPTSVAYLVTSTVTTANAIRLARLDGGASGTTTGSIFLQFPMTGFSLKKHAESSLMNVIG